MKVIMIVVSSVNGKTTRGEEENIYAWTSKEDQELFFSLRNRASLIVMGRKTYEAAKEHMDLSSRNRRIVLTRNPQAYKTFHIPQALEFTNEDPKDVVARMEKEGYEEILLVGGVEVDAAFLQEGLVDEIHLTIEPVLFGKGKKLLADFPFDVQLSLLEMKKLNDRGTLHLIYAVEK